MPIDVTSRTPPTRVLYLWGAGATQAEIDYRGGSSVNLLMADSEENGPGVATRILEKLPASWASRFSVDRGPDIEKLISLCAGCSVPEYSAIAERLRKLYFKDICLHLAVAKVLDEPTLAIALLTLHNDAHFQRLERLVGIITTNHDGLLQTATQKVRGAVNLGIPFASRHLRVSKKRQAPLIQLHGSFSWNYADPIRIRQLRKFSRYSPDTVWIPPTTSKDAKHYPFNKLAGTAYELLSQQCDVLRVVGSSLTQNDWHVLSMIFSAQRHSEHRDGSTFKIELIMPQSAGEAVTRSCSFLKKLMPIGHLGEGDFAEYKEAGALPSTSELRNPLFYWLKQKLQFHHRKGELGPQPLTGVLATVAGDAP